MPLLLLGLGSNQGRRKENLETAIHALTVRLGTCVRRSAFYETEPWGFSSEMYFLNAAIALLVQKSPHQILAITQQIERALGRTQKSVEGQYHDRPIDIDLLAYDDRVMNTPELTLPHPLMHRRAFVLQPLCEIAPQWRHPLLGMTAIQLYQMLETGGVTDIPATLPKSS